MIKEIQDRGKLPHECSFRGEAPAGGFYPGHANGVQVGHDRFLM